MSEATEYLKGKGKLERNIIKIAYGRRWGSKPILVPLHMVLKEIEKAREAFPLKEQISGFPPIDFIKWYKKYFVSEENK